MVSRERRAKAAVLDLWKVLQRGQADSPLWSERVGGLLAGWTPVLAGSVCLANSQQALPA